MPVINILSALKGGEKGLLFFFLLLRWKRNVSGIFFFFCEGSEALVLWFGFSLHVFRTGLDGWGQKQRLMWSFASYCVFLRLVLKIVEVVCFTRLVSCFETVSK